MYRIDRVQFETRDEAEQWAHGNIGGVYSIVPLTFCHTCGDWQDDGDRCDVCGAYKADDGEFYRGCKALAQVGMRYWQMPTSHPYFDTLRAWVFGFPKRG